MDFFKNLFSNKGTSVFDEFDTENHIYQILIRNVREKNSKLNYFLDDNVLIKNLPKKWKLPLAEDICRGGYDYSISIFKDNSLEKLILVCFTCHRFAIQNSDDNHQGNLFEISKEKFQSFLKDDFEPIEIITKKFNNRRDALEFWENEQSNPRLIKQHQLLPDWMKFEGEYTLTFSINKADEKMKPKEYLEGIIKKFGDCGEYQCGQIVATGNEDSYEYIFFMKSSKKLFGKFDEFEPKMLVKNQVEKPKDFFEEDWIKLKDDSLQLFYKR